MESKNHKATLPEIIGYGLGDFPGTANALLAAFLTMFYTDSIGMAAGTAGTMFFISKLFDGITDLIAGSIIDRTKTKWGKARPWLLWLSVPVGLSLALIFWMPQDASNTTQFIYAFLTYNLYSSILYTMVGVAKTAMMPLITQDGASRGLLATCSILFGLGGSILAMSITFPLLAKFGNGNTMEPSAWRTLFLIYGAIVTAGLLACFLLTKEHVTAVEDIVTGDAGREKMSFVDGLRNFFQNKYFLFSLVISTLVSLNLNLNSGSQTYFYKYAMNDEMLTTKLNLYSLVPTIISLLCLATPCLKYLGKKKSVYIGATGQIIGYVLRGLAASTANMPMLIIGTVLCSISTAPLSVPVNCLTADAVDYGEYLTNKRIEGMGSSVVSFSQKVATGLSAGIVGWVLQLVGFVANETQSAGTLTAITALFAWIPALMLVIIIIAFSTIYKYDKEEAIVLAELEKRKSEV